MASNLIAMASTQWLLVTQCFAYSSLAFFPSEITLMISLATPDTARVGSDDRHWRGTVASPKTDGTTVNNMYLEATN